MRPSFERGYSSAGRALAWHARGQRFDPAYLHQKDLGSSKRNRIFANLDFKLAMFLSIILPLCPHRLEA